MGKLDPDTQTDLKSMLSQVTSMSQSATALSKGEDEQEAKAKLRDLDWAKEKNILDSIGKEEGGKQVEYELLMNHHSADLAVAAKLASLKRRSDVLKKSLGGWTPEKSTSING